MKLRSLILMISTGFILISCGGMTNVIQRDFDRVNKNTGIDDFRKTFGSDCRDRLKIERNGSVFNVLFSNMIESEGSEEYKVVVDDHDHKGKDGKKEKKHKTETRTNYYQVIFEYYFVFKDGKYYFSGFLYEFLRHNNPDLFFIGKEILRGAGI